MTRRKIIFTCFVSLAALLAIGAIAWACTPSSYLFPISPGSGQPGTEAVVRGGQFGTGTVEIRWNSTDGRLLATALGPEFSTKVTIPDKAEGVHYLVAVSRDPSDPAKVLARRSESFQITGGANSGSRSISSLWGDAGRPAAEDSGIPAAALAAIGFSLAAGAMAAVTAVIVRRRRAESY